MFGDNSQLIFTQNGISDSVMLKFSPDLSISLSTLCLSYTNQNESCLKIQLNIQPKHGKNTQCKGTQQ